MPETNRKQALFPHGAQRIDNAFGTAPGFSFILNRCRFYCLPGVPREMKGIFRTRLQAELQQLAEGPVITQTVFHTVGTGESALQALLNTTEIPKAVELGFRTKGLENLVKLRYPSTFNITPLRETIAALLSEWLFAITDPGCPQTSLETETLNALDRSGYSIFLAEPQSLGRVAAILAHSRSFLGGLLPGPKLLPNLELQDWARQLAQETGADLVLVQPPLSETSAMATLRVGLLTPQGFQEDQRRLSQDPSRNLETACSLSLNLIRSRLGALENIRKP
jgi:molybdopterin-biosynthesis enzyme MoeA-like protein